MKSVFLARPDAAGMRRKARGVAGWTRIWMPSLLACVVIACESTKTMAATNTSGWLRPFFESVFGHISDSNWAVIHHVIRKSGHFVGYGLVCLTFLRGWLMTLGQRPQLTSGAWKLRSCGLAVASTFVVASCDEWHQTFTPGRSGAFSDVLLDTCGASVLCLVVWLLFWWRRGVEG